MCADFTVESLVSLSRVGALVAHPDGAWSVAVVERLDADRSKYVSDLWRVPHDGGPATRLTRGDTKDRAPAFLADGTLLFLSDRTLPKGDEARAQIWALPAHGEAYPLSDEPHGVSDFKCAGTTLVALVELLPHVPLDEQRKRLADKKKHGPSILKYTAQPVRFWDRWLGPTEPRLVAFDIDAGALKGRRELTADAGDALRENSWDLSADGRLVVITWAVMSAADRMHDKPLALIGTSGETSGARTMLGVQRGVVHAAPRFAPDGQKLVAQRYERSRDGYAQRSLWRYDLPDAGARDLTPTWDRWPGAWGVQADGTIVTTAEHDGRSLVFLVDLETGAHRAIGENVSGSWDSLALVPGGKALVGVRSDLLAPPDPFIVDLATGELRPLASLSGFVAPAALPTARTIQVAVGPRTDGTPRSMAAFIVEPPVPNGRTLFWIHGGPVASWSEHWHWRWSSLLMAGQGYRVVLPNPSGSTGYGIDWVNDIWGNTWGERCHDDLLRLIAQLEAEGTNARDMVIMGGSFGGYMTNWIGTHGERFRALVTHASLYDMSAFHGVTDFPSWWELMMGGAPWSDPDFDRFSPSRKVQGWKTPTLILHGEKDYRVPVGEGLALFEALQALGVPSELVIFPDENHWILKPNNVIAWYETVLAFLDREFAAEPLRAS